MKVLVTGGGGYKGSILVNKLLSLKKIQKVVVIDTFWFGNHLKLNNQDSRLYDQALWQKALNPIMILIMILLE